MQSNDRRVVAPDGTRIAYGVAGSGPALMLTNGLTTSTGFWKHLQPRWRTHHTVITWDLPGHGSSAPSVSSAGASIEALPAIMARILDAEGIAQAVHIGWSVGSQIVLEMYRQFPERVSALATLFGPAGNALQHTRLPVSGRHLEQLAGHGQAAHVAALVTYLARLPVGSALTALLRRARLIGERTSPGDLREILDHVVRLDPHTLPLMTLSCQRHSAFDVLPRVAVPLLIMAGGQDPFMPLETVAKRMHEAAPGSELVVLETATHAALLDFPDEIGVHVEDFLARHTH